MKLLFLLFGRRQKVVTQGTNEGGSNMNRNRGTNGPKNGYNARRQGGRDGQDENRPKGTRGDGRNGNRNGNFNNRPVKTERYDNRNKGYGAPKFAGKDEDDEDLGRRSKPSRPKESKPGVAIPDKNKAMLRLEKEQKNMKKKQQSKKKESNRPQPKQKRSNNINYTRSYANGDYDDYEDYYDL